MKMGPRNLILTHVERDGQRTRLGTKAGGRPALRSALQRRHELQTKRVLGAGGVRGVELVRISGTRSSWPGGEPQASNVLIAQGGEKFGSWLKLEVVSSMWWDRGTTLELIVRVVDAQARQRKVACRGVLALAIAGVMLMADQPQSGTYAHLPVAQMNAWLADLDAWGDDVRKESMPLVVEAVLSEAQVDSPRLTGFTSDSHVVLEDNVDVDGSMVAGVNTTYALALHETHPTKKRWFLRAIVEHFPRTMEATLRKLAREKGAR